MIRFIAPMVAGGGGAKRSSLGAKVLVPLAILTLAGFVLDQWIHGRFL